MKYPERIARRGQRPFHTAISTTFAIEFAAFEEIMLPQIMASGATNTLLVTDGRMATMSLSDGMLLPYQLGRDYEMVSPPSELGLFHPKILLQLGRKSGRLFVGSANVTAAGIAGNAEAIFEVECTEEPGPAQAIVRSAWRYLSDLLQNERDTARDALEWAASPLRTPWLAGADDEEDSGVVELDDGTLMGFWPGGSAYTSIGQRFVEAIAGEAVERLVVVSPYWDSRLIALTDLTEALQPTETSVLLDPENHQFPVGVPRPAMSFRNLPKRIKGRFTHAKVIIASTATRDHVLVGSANCTVAALGRPGVPGVNAEACIYRRLDRDKGADALDLTDSLLLPAIDLLVAEPTKTEDIPLAEMTSLKAGSFEVVGVILTWRPKRSLPEGGTLEIFDPSSGFSDTLNFAPLKDMAERTFHLSAETAAKATFVIVKTTGFKSAPTHVSHRSVLRGRRRETTSGAVARATDIFDTAADFTLFMIQSYEYLDRADMEEQEAGHQITAARPGRIRDAASEPERHQLSYDEFMQTRSPDRIGVGRQDSTVTGKHTHNVRQFLNRLIGISHMSAPTVNDDWLDNLDEDGEFNGDTSDTPLPKDNADRPIQKPPGATKNFDLKPVVDAVQSYVTRSTEGSVTGPSDVMRLRLWLMFLIHQAKHADDAPGLETNGSDTGWPWLARRIIASFFMGKEAPIRRLMIAKEYQELPPDFLECFATIVWTIDCIEAALGKSKHEATFIGHIRQLRAVVSMRLALTPAEVSSSTYRDVHEGLNRTLGPRIMSYKS